MILRRNTCHHVRDQLPLHVGNDLEPNAAERVDAHLKSCLSCFREFRELATMRGRLGVLAEEPLPAGILDGFTEEVMARIAIGEPGPAAEPPVPARVLRPFAWQRVAAVAAVVLVAVSTWKLVDDPAVTRPSEGGAEAPVVGPESSLVAHDESATQAGDAQPELRGQPAVTPFGFQSPALRGFGAGSAQPVSVGHAPQPAAHPFQGMPQGFETIRIEGMRLPSEADRMVIFQLGVPGFAPGNQVGTGLQLDQPREPRLREP